MNTPTIPFILLLFFSYSTATSAHDSHHFLKCLSQQFQNHSSNISNLIYTPTNPSYSSILYFPIWNLRFTSESTPKPQIIITPDRETQIPPIVRCAKHTGMEIRTRSGGHDFEGLSSSSKLPFVIIDMIRLSKTTVDVETMTAWVEGGATLGSLYYSIAQKSAVLGFPAGVCTTVGVGGHISGGGYGTLMRRFGMAADHVVDARIVDANGRILDRKSMGEDLFWAIRGGGGASFGVITAWKLQLVDVPKTVTVFNIQRTLEENLTQIIHRWQHVAPRLDRDITLDINAAVISTAYKGESRKTTIGAYFSTVFLGGVDRLFSLMQQSFPELGLIREDCIEMSWIQSVLYSYGYPIDQLQTLLNRTQLNKSYMKRKIDYVQTPLSLQVLESIMKLYFEPEARQATLSFAPYGGVMDDIPESSIPFPHRAGNLYQIMHTVYWEEGEAKNSDKYLKWVRRAFKFMTPYVSKSPRTAYLNYRDLDIGVNNNLGKTSYLQASTWGKKYFKNNFKRLVRVKTKVDPMNFFTNEQSIPSLH